YPRGELGVMIRVADDLIDIVKCFGVKAVFIEFKVDHEMQCRLAVEGVYLIIAVIEAIEPHCFEGLFTPARTGSRVVAIIGVTITITVSAAVAAIAIAAVAALATAPHEGIAVVIEQAFCLEDGIHIYRDIDID